MTFNELEMLSRDVKCDANNLNTLQELFDIAKLHLRDTGNELLLNIKIKRGLSVEEPRPMFRQEKRDGNS